MPRAPMPKQAIRIPKDKWDRFGRVTDAAGTDRSTVLRELVDWYLRERGGILPERPPRES